MEALQPMFPNLDPVTLQHALEAHNNSVERTVDYLLSEAQTRSPSTTSNNINRQAQFLQEESDAELARRLQMEQDAHDRAYYSNNNPNQPNTSSPSSSATPFSLPSLSDVQSAVKPIVDGVQYAGRVAAESVNTLYRDYIAPDAHHPSSSSSPNRFQDRRQDDSMVITNDHDPHARHTPRHRRNVNTNYGFAPTDKKDA